VTFIRLILISFFLLFTIQNSYAIDFSSFDFSKIKEGYSEFKSLKKVEKLEKENKRKKFCLFSPDYYKLKLVLSDLTEISLEDYQNSEYTVISDNIINKIIGIKLKMTWYF
jgi:hypothetical protein